MIGWWRSASFPMAAIWPPSWFAVGWPLIGLNSQVASIDISNIQMLDANYGAPTPGSADCFARRTISHNPSLHRALKI